MTDSPICKRTVLALAILSVLCSYIHAGVVTVWGDVLNLNEDVRTWINSFYNSLPGHSSSIAADSLLTAVDLTTTDLLWITQPADNYTIAELREMAAFIAAGGRIAFLGEYCPVAREENECGRRSG